MINPRNPAALAAFLSGGYRNAEIASTPGGIEAQEAAGQAAMVASRAMPSDMHPNREAYEALGFVFGEPTDDLFVAASLPAGWTYAPTDHSMWSSIKDETGRVRVDVFYKAAFYDRRAYCRINRGDD